MYVMSASQINGEGKQRRADPPSEMIGADKKMRQLPCQFRRVGRWFEHKHAHQCPFKLCNIDSTTRNGGRINLQLGTPTFHLL